MTPKEAQRLVQAGQAILVDVREEEELKESGLAEGACWMPLSAVENDTDQWRLFRRNLPRDKQILLYCRSGRRSGRIAELLCCDGLQAVNLGGFCDWQGCGLPVKPYRP